MKRRLFAALALAVTGVVVLVAPPPAEAVSAPTSGWWSRLATTDPASELPAALPVPAPTTPDTVPVGATVPEGQLLVEGSTDGPTAITAIRWQLDEGESGPSLTLAVAEGSSVNPQSVVLACRTATPWEPPETLPGRWSTRPLADGRTCVNGILADDLSTISFGIQPLVSGDALDIVLTPGQVSVDVPPGVPQPPVDIDGSSFRLVVEAPTPESLEVVAGSGFEQGSGDQFVTPDPSSTPTFGETDTFTPETDVGSDFAPGGETAEIPAFEVPEEVASPDTGGTSDDVASAVPAASDGSPANRTIGFILLALAGLMAAWTYMTSTTDQPTTIGLGRFKTTLPAGAAMAPVFASAPPEPAVGGLSRFSRTRTKPPTPLS